MAKHNLTIKRKGKCECGMRKHSLKTLNEHSRARGHKLVALPSKSSSRPSIKGKKE